MQGSAYDRDGHARNTDGDVGALSCDAEAGRSFLDLQNAGFLDLQASLGDADVARRGCTI